MFLVADAAASFNGKLYIHGGGISRITAPLIPWHQPSLAVVARFLLDEDELGEPQRLGIRLVDPDDALVVPPAHGEATVDPSDQTVVGEEYYLQLAITLGPVLFTREGVFRFELLIDDEVVWTLPIPVVAPHAE